jgi:hypothetical protein
VTYMVKAVFWQAVLAALTGPVILSIFSKMHQRLNPA